MEGHLFCLRFSNTAGPPVSRHLRRGQTFILRLHAFSITRRAPHQPDQQPHHTLLALLRSGAAALPHLWKGEAKSCYSGALYVRAGSGGNGWREDSAPHRHRLCAVPVHCIGCLARRSSRRAEAVGAALLESRLMLAVWFGAMFEGGRAAARAQIMHR